MNPSTDKYTKWVIVFIVIIIVMAIFVWWIRNDGRRRSQHLKFDAALNGEQENPPTSSMASGKGFFTLSEDRSSLDYDITITGLKSYIKYTQLYRENRNNNDESIVTLNSPLQTENDTFHFRGTWSSNDENPLSNDLVDDLIGGDVYVNIHSEEYPDGEIRGQLNEL